METELVGKYVTRPEDAHKRGRIVAAWDDLHGGKSSLFLAVAFKGEGGKITVLSHDKVRMMGN